jgi:hypothetical protein
MARWPEFKPSSLAQCPYYQFAVGHLSVGEARYVLDDDIDSFVRFLDDWRMSTVGSSVRATDETRRTVFRLPAIERFQSSLDP